MPAASLKLRSATVASPGAMAPQRPATRRPVPTPANLSGTARTHLLWLAVAALLGWAPLGAFAASFACDKARTSVELAICASPEVSQLDEYLGRYYAAARMALKHADECLASDQRAWLQTTRNPCKSTDCLKQAYLRRLSVLHGVQPGATSLRNLELPAGPSLVWIIPAAADQVSAPRDRASSPLSASGRILDEVAAGDGYALETAAGSRHLIAALMFLEPPTTDALAQLPREGNSRFEVRGRTEPGSRNAFAPAHCTYVYRVQP